MATQTPTSLALAAAWLAAVRDPQSVKSGIDWRITTQVGRAVWDLLREEETVDGEIDQNRLRLSASNAEDSSLTVCPDWLVEAALAAGEPPDVPRHYRTA